MLFIDHCEKELKAGGGGRKDFSMYSGHRQTEKVTCKLRPEGQQRASHAKSQQETSIFLKKTQAKASK